MKDRQSDQIIQELTTESDLRLNRVGQRKSITKDISTYPEGPLKILLTAIKYAYEKDGNFNPPVIWDQIVSRATQQERKEIILLLLNDNPTKKAKKPPDPNKLRILTESFDKPIEQIKQEDYLDKFYVSGASHAIAKLFVDIIYDKKAHDKLRKEIQQTLKNDADRWQPKELVASENQIIIHAALLEWAKSEVHKIDPELDLDSVSNIDSLIKKIERIQSKFSQKFCQELKIDYNRAFNFLVYSCGKTQGVHETSEQTDKAEARKLQKILISLIAKHDPDKRKAEQEISALLSAAQFNPETIKSITRQAMQTYANTQTLTPLIKEKSHAISEKTPQLRTAEKATPKDDVKIKKLQEEIQELSASKNALEIQASNQDLKLSMTLQLARQARQTANPAITELAKIHLDGKSAEEKMKALVKFERDHADVLKPGYKDPWIKKMYDSTLLDVKVELAALARQTKAAQASLQQPATLPPGALTPPNHEDRVAGSMKQTASATKTEKQIEDLPPPPAELPPTPTVESQASKLPPPPDQLPPLPDPSQKPQRPERIGIDNLKQLIQAKDVFQKLIVLKDFMNSKRYTGFPMLVNALEKQSFIDAAKAVTYSYGRRSAAARAAEKAGREEEPEAILMFKLAKLFKRNFDEKIDPKMFIDSLNIILNQLITLKNKAQLNPSQDARSTLDATQDMSSTITRK